MIVQSGPPIAAPRQQRYIIAVNSLEAIGIELVAFTGGGVALDTNYPAANLAFYVPFAVTEPITVTRMWVRNGTEQAGNIDVGIYSAAGTRLVAMGSTAQSGDDIIQDFNITDTLLMPGRYYMAMASDTSGATQKVNTYSFPANFGEDILRAIGVYQEASAFPLPSTATFAAATQVQVPLFGLATRSFVA